MRYEYVHLYDMLLLQSMLKQGSSAQKTVNKPIENSNRSLNNLFLFEPVLPVAVSTLFNQCFDVSEAYLLKLHNFPDPTIREKK